MYKAEFFAQDMAFEAAYLLQEDTTLLSEDHLTMDSFDVDIPTEKTPVRKGHFCRISRVNGGFVQDFIVADCALSKTTASVSLKPLLALLDAEVYTAPVQDCAAWITQQITEYFVASDDAAQNREIAVKNDVSTGTRPLRFDEDTINLLEPIAAALTNYKIAVQARLDLPARQVVFVIREIRKQITLEADFANVLQKDITLGDSNAGANKYIVRRISTDSDSGAVTVLGKAVYYLHPDGSVDAMNTNRILPVVWELGVLENSETWDADALAQAKEALTPQQYDNEIRLDYKRDDMMISPESLPIGTEATIYTGGKAYRSLLTGREWDGGIHRLIFGQVRVDLTKKLILQRRNKS